MTISAEQYQSNRFAMLALICTLRRARNNCDDSPVGWTVVLRHEQKRLAALRYAYYRGMDQ